eukprot:scaffold121_cov108-Skeletonema_dohrnii-CCMP3373.AAC.1
MVMELAKSIVENTQEDFDLLTCCIGFGMLHAKTMVASPTGEPQGNTNVTAIRSYGHHNELLAGEAPCHSAGTAVI